MGQVRARYREGLQVLTVNHGQPRRCHRQMGGSTPRVAGNDRSSKLVLRVAATCTGPRVDLAYSRRVWLGLTLRPDAPVPVPASDG